MHKRWHKIEQQFEAEHSGEAKIRKMIIQNLC